MKLPVLVLSLVLATTCLCAPLRPDKSSPRGLSSGTHVDAVAAVLRAASSSISNTTDYGNDTANTLQELLRPVIDPTDFNLPAINYSTGQAILQTFGQIVGAPGPAPVVNLTQGNYIGLRNFPLLQQEQFLGIPFAAPPTGNLRFASPRPYEGQAGQEFQANQLPASCWQPNDYLIHFADGDTVNRRDEDCLTLSVYSPLGLAGSEKRLPVLVWLFGGGDIGGSANSYNGSALVLQSILMDQPMIVVTPQYRLNSFGFLAGVQATAGAEGATLNAGTQDITQALQWVKDNIAAFGGDPDKITFGGQSSGAFNTGAQLLKDGIPGAAPPVYRAAIMLSGTPMSEPSPKSDSAFAEDNFQRIAGAVGCTGEQATIACLRGIAPEALAEATFFPSTSKPDPSQGFLQGPYYLAGTQPFQLTTDGVYHRDGADAQLARGEMADVPLLTGSVKDEGTFFASRQIYADSVADYLATISFPDTTLPGTGTMVDSWLQAYPDDPAVGAPYTSLYLLGGISRFGPGNQYERVASILGDNAFISKRRYLIDSWLKTKKSAVYSYLFDITPYPEALSPFGVCHGCDVPFWFGQYAFAPQLFWPPAMQASQFASAALVSFVNNMNPNHAGLPNWPRYDAAEKHIMHITGQPSVITDDYRSVMNGLFTTPDTFKLMTT